MNIPLWDMVFFGRRCQESFLLHAKSFRAQQSFFVKNKKVWGSEELSKVKLLLTKAVCEANWLFAFFLKRLDGKRGI